MKKKKSISKKLLRTRDEIKLSKLRSDIDGIDIDIEIEENILPKISENPRIFYKYAKFKAKTCENIGPLQNEKGDILTNDSDMVDILNKQYSSVFSPILSDETYENFTSQRIDNLNVNIEMPVVYFSDILLREAIKKMRNFALPGPDGMYGACLKHGGIFVEHALGDIFNKSLEIEVAPQ